ncbi:MAG: GNAT family N-acetyltransferase, partial [Bosea sp. (in: a-proteobacteria)]|nr:GNAT family N-acetyltransferase [Bosea sp. (in: a-proteobacteria)]
MTNDEAITVEQLDAQAAQAAIPALAGILADAVENGASVGFMHWNGTPDYLAFWSGVAADVAAGRTVLFAARRGADVLGTAQLQLVGKPNQPHRAEIAKVL